MPAAYGRTGSAVPVAESSRRKVAAPDVEIGARVDPVDRPPLVGLPDPPSLDVGAAEDTSMPDRAVQLVPDRVAVLKVAPDVEHQDLARRLLDLVDEGSDLPIHPVPVRPRRAVARELEVQRRRKLCCLPGDDADEIRGLLPAGPAEGEEVVRAAVQPGRPCTRPVPVEARIDEVTTLGRLDVGELDVVGGDPIPVDRPLVARHVDAVALALPEIRPVSRQPAVPAPGTHDHEPQHDDTDDEGPPPAPIPCRRIHVTR